MHKSSERRNKKDRDPDPKLNDELGSDIKTAEIKTGPVIRKDGGPRRKLRVLSGKRSFKRCRKCRSVNPIMATKCFKCGNSLDDDTGKDRGQADTKEE